MAACELDACALLVVLTADHARLEQLAPLARRRCLPLSDRRLFLHRQYVRAYGWAALLGEVLAERPVCHVRSDLGDWRRRNSKGKPSVLEIVAILPNIVAKSIAKPSRGTEGFETYPE